MNNCAAPFPAILKDIRALSVALLLLLLQIILPLPGQEVLARNYSVQPLNLSRAPASEELMAAGQLGGPLHPTHSPTDKAREAAINTHFGAAIQLWNKHDYREAVELFRAHLAQHPDSPWAAEALLHIGCDALYNGRHGEANRCFESILLAHQANSHPGAQMLVHKARLRLANLRTAQGNFPEATEHFRLLKQTSPDWRHRTYAAHWIQRISRLMLNQLAVVNCGGQALAHLLEKRGKKAAAEKVRAQLAASPRGQSLQELTALAAGHGYRLTGLKLSAAQLKEIPLPAIVQISGQNRGDRGHYWVLEARTKDRLKFYDPQGRRRFSQTAAEFSREWDGHALVFAGRQKLPGIILAAQEMANLYGGCCGTPAPEGDNGDPPCDPGDPDNPSPDACPSKKPRCDSPDDPPTGPPSGSPAWSVNKINLNFYVKDIPLWYRSPIGPKVEIALSYNSQSAIATYEPFGNKWQFNYATYLVEDSGGTVTVFMPDGRRDAYTPNSSGGYNAPAGVYNTLVKSAPTHYELWFLDDSVYVYDVPAGTNSLQPFLVEKRDAHGLSLHFGYDADVHLTSITDAVGRVTNLTYNAAGLVTGVTDPFGRQASFDYDANANLTRLTDMGGYWSSITYDQDCYITGIANARGAWGFYTEPADGIDNGSNPYPPPGGVMYGDYRLTVTNPLGFKEEYYWCGTPHGWAWHVSPLNYVEYVDLDHSNYKALKTIYYHTMVANKGKLQSLWPAGGGFISYGYDAVGNRNFLNRWGGWYYSYNARGRVTSVTNPRSMATTLSYAANNVDLISKNNGITNLTYTYNTTHDLVSVTDNVGTPHTTSYTYNSYGQVTSVTDALGLVNNYLYDEAHRPVAITRDGQTILTYTYDALDRLRSQTDASGLTLTYDYNDLDQVTAISYPDGKSKTYQYSTCCPFIVDSITERSGQTTFYSYDAMNHLMSVTDPAGLVTSFSYDKNGNRASLTDPKGQTTSFAYDAGNRLLRKTYADGTFESYTYGPSNPFRLPATRINARGVTTNYTYDNMLHLTADGPQTSYYFDAYGRKVWDSGPGGTWNYTYDANSRLSIVNGPWANDNVTYQYDALGRRISMIREKGQTVAYIYDSLHRLSTVTAGTQVYTYGYTAASPLVRTLTRPDGSVTTYDYDILNRLTALTTTVSGVTVSRYAYTYNQQDYRDGEDAVEAGPGLSDALAKYTYNNVNQLTQISDPGARNLTYDADGNLTGGYTPEGFAFTATYDADNRLSTFSYTDAAGAVNRTEFSYIKNLLLKQRVLKNGALTQERRYVYSGMLLTQERDSNNNLVREYTYGIGMGGGIGGALALNQGGAWYSYLYDGKGNVMALLNGSGQVAQTYQYDPFGVPMGSSGSVNQPLQFSTKPFDDKTGLSFYGFRFYNASLGRWLTRDPIGEAGGINLYGFVGNNPINKIDPWGLEGTPGPGSEGGPCPPCKNDKWWCMKYCSYKIATFGAIFFFPVSGVAAAVAGGNAVTFYTDSICEHICDELIKCPHK